MIKALKGRNAAMMQNHGSVAYGSTMARRWNASSSSSGWPSSTGGRRRWAPRQVLTDKDFEAIIVSAMEKGYGGVKKVDKKDKKKA